MAADPVVLIGVIVSFAVIILLIRRKFHFGASLFIGALVLGVFSLQTISLLDIPQAILEASIYSFRENRVVTDTLEIAVLTTLIYVLAKAMQETGSIQHLIHSLRGFFSKGGILGVIPAVYGLMPSPGGAYLSAPMVDTEGDLYRLSTNQKNFLNVWFRHIWFPIYPVSAAMILLCSAEFAHIDIYLLALIELPAFFVATLLGLFFLKKFITKENLPVSSPGQTATAKGLRFLLPPLLPLIIYAVLFFFGVSQTHSFLIGVGLSLILLYLLLDVSPRQYLCILRKSFTWKLFFAIFGIMIFREMFEVSTANMMIADSLTGFSIPAVMLVVLIPLLLGFLTSYNYGAIALSYPLVVSFYPLTGLPMVGFASIVFISALVGYLISPIHLCNVLSSEYYKTDPTRIYRWFVPAALIMLFVQVSFVLLLSAVVSL